MNPANLTPSGNPTDGIDLRSEWHAFCDRLKDGAEVVLDPARPGDDVDRAEGLRALLRRTANEVSRVLEGGGTERPELAWIHPFKNGQDNPDALYQMAELDLSRTYRLSGSVGTVRYLGITAMTTDFASADIQQFLNLNGDDLTAEPHGEFEVFFGAGPAPDGTPDDCFLEMPPRRCSLIVRQFFNDWESEAPADLHLECLDAPTEPGRLDPARLAAEMHPMADRVVDMTAFWAGFGQAHLERNQVNSFDHSLGHVRSGHGATADQGGSLDQGYGQTWYRIAPEEALLLEVYVPECAYWGIQLGDVWYQSLDWWNHQSSLNGHQAVVSDDGIFRAVISHHDPGIANWLDTTGSNEGCITYRWNQATSQPVPTCRLIPFAEIADHLDHRWAPITPDERRTVLRSRRRGALRRFRR